MCRELYRWLLESGEPWTRYRTLLDLQNIPEDDPVVRAARADLLAHPQIQALVAKITAWPGYAMKRHNDARHSMYALSTLADFGLRAEDPGIAPGIAAVMAHQSPEGAFECLVNIPKAFGGTGEDVWSWMACDGPTLLYALLSMGRGNDPQVQAAAWHLVSLVLDNGWRCAAAPQLGGFKGPGRRTDPCPIANVYALKALSQVPELLNHPAAQAGAEMLLSHWEQRGVKKYFLFGIGSDFRKLKYPFVWYDILHVAEVLSRFPFARRDARLGEIIDVITARADEDGRYTAESMYRAWKGWSFADKRHPSPWLTFLVLRIQRRMGQSS